MSEIKKTNVSFASIEPYVETNIILPTEKVTSTDMVEWGQGNIYPNYLNDLYDNVTTLRSVINGNVDFIVGNGVSILPLGDRFVDGVMNSKGDTIEDMVEDIARDFNIYGGFAIQVIRDHNGDVAELYHIDLQNLRSNKENDVFYYCEKWQNRGKKSVIKYPAFMSNLNWSELDEEQRNNHASSILFVKNNRRRVYPSPVYCASVKASEIERCIDDYHLNNLENGFAPSVVINLNNGDPIDEVKKQIENDIIEKFSGHQNAGRIMICWNKDKESATTIEAIKTEDFGTKYDSLTERSSNQIFSAFRASPLLFGLATKVNTGFSTEEFEQSFKLYNRTFVRPMQRKIANAFDKIYGSAGVLTIEPFTLSGEAEEEVK